MASEEPVLRAADVRAWSTWMRTAATHARTRDFARTVDSARRLVELALSRAVAPSVSWSAGKDSTCLAHLVVVDAGAKHVELMSEKDDLDYPGEEAYVTGLAATWGAKLRIVRPPISPAQWIRDHAAELHPGDDIHARAAGLSKACFYSVVEEADRAYDCVMLGLRSEESERRRILRETRGRFYPLRGRAGQLRALPVADWRGVDVYAYAVSRGIELLPVYRCIGLMHADRPWMVRKSWWLPGGQTANGQVVWLRRYWPSLYRQLCEWLPGARMFG